MNPSFKHSIGVRFLRVVFGSYLVVTLVVTSTQLYVEYNNVEQQVITELSNVAQSFGDGLGKSLWNLDTESINFILSGIRKIDVIAGVKVTDLQNEIQGATGVYIGPNTPHAVLGPLGEVDPHAREITLIREGGNASYYQYQTDIIFQEFTDTRPELIGRLHLYAERDTVVQRFKNSFFLIITIALIKTVALWLIFLYFARRVVARPLNELTEATQALGHNDPNNSVIIPERLRHLAQSSSHDELQQLAASFLQMQQAISTRIDNLDQLNNYGIALTRANDQQQAFQRTFELLNSLFACKFAALFGDQEKIEWSTVDEDKLAELSIIDARVHLGEALSASEEALEITYTQDGATFPADPENHNWLSNIPMLTLPFDTPDWSLRRLRFFGALAAERLDEHGQLSSESLAILQVVVAMLSNTLTSLQQRTVIQQQNQQLEQRVQERTRELAQVNAELKHLAVHDPLTQLPNRTLFNDRLDQLIHLAKRESREFAVASIDLSKFKQINDTFGHDAGDTVLTEVGRRFARALRSSDTMARMGGDEFAAIFSGRHIGDNAIAIAKQLQRSLQTPISLSDGNQVAVGANIGLALYPRHAQSAEMLFKNADIAMYQAKRNGLGYAVFDQQKSLAEKESLQLLTELEYAIRDQQLTLYYQPIMHIASRRVIGLEALLRWNHPDRGLIPPDMFIPQAERSIHIHTLTQWVLEQACRQCAALHREGHLLSVSVNLSPQVFTSPELPGDLQGLLERNQLDAKWIKLEITESTAMDNPDQAQEIFAHFREMGSPISIDDFGTGHSSLAYLTRLPLDELKIDKSFLTTDSNSNRIVVETIIDLAHTLNLRVVAEGIENEATLTMLQQKGCDAAQGYHIARPAPIEAIVKMLEQQAQQRSLS